MFYNERPLYGLSHVKVSSAGVTSFSGSAPDGYDLLLVEAKGTTWRWTVSPGTLSDDTHLHAVPDGSTVLLPIRVGQLRYKGDALITFLTYTPPR